MSALVSLVGAGPGDPDLLTVRAARVLGEAQLVLYDALVDPRVLALARRAMKVHVGKRAGRHSMTQESINALLVRAGRNGRRVVRLKCGDPFVFGRGGEEALALEAAGVPFEIVPGLSSAIAGPGAAGIPVTHRGVASAFVVVTGHPAAARRRVLDGLAPGCATLVVLMGLAIARELRDDLIAHGWDSRTPAALILGAHGPRQWTWMGTLEELPLVTAPADRADLPGLIVIGEVVDVGRQLSATSLTEAIANVQA